MSDTANADHNLGSDLLWGARAIADEIGVSPRKAFYLLESGAIPAQKIRGLWVGSKRRLRASLTGEVAA
jgi:hypothetical protein